MTAPSPERLKMTTLTDEEIAALKAAALAVTPQNIDSAQEIDHFKDGSHIECPACGGDGYVEREADFCNYDGTAIGVQFYGVGNAHGAAEAYLRAAMPANILALIERLERADTFRALLSASKPAATVEREEIEQARDRVLEQSKNSLFRSGVKICATEILSPTEQCNKPPEGWKCSRVKGHEGPCAASPAAPAQSAHPDDLAVDQFATAMKDKLAQARAKGRGGWQQCDPTELSIMLREHVEKGDPRDVANFCMFLWCLGQPISDAALPMGKRATAAVVLDDERATWEQLRGSLAVAMCGFATKTGNKGLDAAVAVIDAITEPGSPIAWLRAAFPQPVAQPVEQDAERATFDLKAFEAAVWFLVEQSRSWEKAYHDSAVLYESLDSYKDSVESEIRYLVNMYRTLLETHISTLGQFRRFARAGSLQPVAQPVEQTAQVPQFDAKHVSLKERTDGKLVLTLLLDGVEGAPRYKVIPVNPGVVRVAQPVEQTRALTSEQIEAIKYAVRWMDENVSNRYAYTAARELRAILAAARPASGETDIDKSL